MPDSFSYENCKYNEDVHLIKHQRDQVLSRVICHEQVLADFARVVTQDRNRKIHIKIPVLLFPG